MPEVRVGGKEWSADAGSTLLDSLLDAGLPVAYSCRAGSCQACKIRLIQGDLTDLQPEALTASARAEGWRLACQCQVHAPVEIALFDPARDALLAQVTYTQWLAENVLEICLESSQPLRYRAGQHVLLWNGDIARPYSFASVPNEDVGLSFHLDCSRPGTFCDAARRLRPGDPIRLGNLSDGALHYPVDAQEVPLLLIGSGTGMAPLWSIVREALRQEHLGPIRLVHRATERTGHYLREPFDDLAERYDHLTVEYLTAEQWPDWLKGLRLSSRQTLALACGGPSFIEAVSRRLFMAGLPKGRLLTDTYLSKALGQK
ncbi:NAD(P)H-flavin reductase [Pseudomonas duriflava]|uniref:NAD(P)H-flavin reductase n=1 Tax=Pseudomonas duriflava TaxID=459528 RepID=A0A562QPA1_9PSED|nr:iron-sulfur-binding ferredoxin reductase [Pseudomonas duriflava]TWI58525.1 NAD(P)H-flavin reductase [Pseudomonas duriflava]